MRPNNFEFLSAAPALLKRDLLYFDQIHLCSANEVSAIEDLQYTNPTLHESILKEFEILQKNNLLFTFNLSEIFHFMMKETKGKLNIEDFTDIKKMMEDFLAIPRVQQLGKYQGKKKTAKKIDQYMNEVNLVENESTRISAQFISRFSAKDKGFPLLQTDSVMGADPFHPAPVLEVVLEKLPIPDENVEWRQIIEYRSDPDAQAKFTALRVWMQDVARKDYSKSEIEEQLSHHLHEYEAHLQLHHLKYTHGTMQILVTTTMEILENIVKLKLGKIAQTFFSLREKRYSLLEAEMSAPGREVAYISKVAKHF